MYDEKENLSELVDPATNKPLNDCRFGDWHHDRDT